MFGYEILRWMILSRMIRVKQVHQFFMMIDDYTTGFISTRVAKIVAVRLITFHVGGCAFFYSAILTPPGKERNSWLGSLTMGEFSYFNFRHIRFSKLYITCLYFAAITITTVGYGDIHPISSADMVIAIMVASVLHFLDAYVNDFLMKPKERVSHMMEQIPNTEQSGNENRFQELVNPPRHEPLAIRLQRLRDLHRPCIKEVLLFKDCTVQFVNEIASRVQQEDFEQGELVVEQGYILEHIYFVSSGELEMLRETGPEITPVLTRSSPIGEISILRDVPQPYDVRVLQDCTVLRLEKKTLKNIMNAYMSDGRKVLENLSRIMGDDAAERTKSPEEIHRDTLEHASKVNLLAFFNDESIRAEPDVNIKDFSGRTPLHIAASLGHEIMARILVEEKETNVNICDNLGNSPLLEAVKGRHNAVIDFLFSKGAKLMIEDEGSFLCLAVATYDVDYVERLLACGMVADSHSKDRQTPLHVAARRGCLEMVKLLMKHGAIPREDRWGILPSDEAMLSSQEEISNELEPEDQELEVEKD